MQKEYVKLIEEYCSAIKNHFCDRLISMISDIFFTTEEIERLWNVYGPIEEPSERTNVFSDFVYRAINTVVTRMLHHVFGGG